MTLSFIRSNESERFYDRFGFFGTAFSRKCIKSMSSLYGRIPSNDKSEESSENADNENRSLGSTNNHSNEEILSKRRKELFGDCALIEIIHLHDCLRGALKALENDVNQLAASIDHTNNATTVDIGDSHINVLATTASTIPQDSNYLSTIVDLERRVAGRFKVIWTVFKSHSHAEDEFIWPALKTKTNNLMNDDSEQHHHHGNVAAVNDNNNDFIMEPVRAVVGPEAHQEIEDDQRNVAPQPVLIEQEEYEEDHADEERMFSQMDTLLQIIREAIMLLQQQNRSHLKTKVASSSDSSDAMRRNNNSVSSSSTSKIQKMANNLLEHTQVLSQHLMTHLQKEETQCMPLVVKHLSKTEIHELVGQIMGQRSADTIAHIMTMAVQNLEPIDRIEMVKYMKQSMAGTFFDRWLLMSGWMNDIDSGNAPTNATSTLPVSADAKAAASSEIDSGADRKLSSEEQKLQQQHEPFDDKLVTTRDEIAKIVPTPEATKKSSELIIQDAKKRAANLETLNNNDALSSEARASSPESKRLKLHGDAVGECISHSEETWPACSPCSNDTNINNNNNNNNSGITGQAELERLIRSIATNPSLTPAQKNTTIQGLRDSVWKSNQRHKQMNEELPIIVNQETYRYPMSIVVPENNQNSYSHSSTRNQSEFAASQQTYRTRRVTPPSAYFRKNQDGKIITVWTSDSQNRATAATCVEISTKRQDVGLDVPLFSASELAPTYHDGATGSVLGCPHYPASCKQRHPKSGRLYTCRICCEQQRELPNNRDPPEEPLDKYSVTEVMCMKCNALQPADDRCINPDCESFGKPFARYYCSICHLYDDGTRPIFHCPYCNTCRLGLGLGIDYRHCMRCNACVSLADKDHHCIPQKLQGNCPICREALFQSTEPLRGLKCGHVMHLACFAQYRRGLKYTCPLCMKSMEDMKDYFALLDTAIRMQPMPAAFINTYSNIYCQDCSGTSRVPYHIVGSKCSHCNSYNTRELGRTHVSPASSPH